jgi:hypothetical protein
VPGEDCTASSRILFGCPWGVAGLYSPPSILEGVLQDADLIRTKYVWRKPLEKAPHDRPPPSSGFYNSARFKIIYRKLVRALSLNTANGLVASMANGLVPSGSEF